MIRGSIHWVSLDKRRPAVVVSPDRRNELANDVIVVPCTTTRRPASWHVPLRKGEGGLPYASIAKCEQVLTVPKIDLDPRPLGPPLSAVRMHAIERALLVALGILVP